MHQIFNSAMVKNWTTICILKCKGFGKFLTYDMHNTGLPFAVLQCVLNIESV